MKKGLFIKVLSITALFLAGILFVIRFGGPSILKLYIETGIGDCQKIPILCLAPPEEMVKTKVNQEYIRELSAAKFPKMTISVPKGFSVVQERVKKVYYKRGKRTEPSESIIYIDRQDPDFLINLFPRFKKYGIKDDFELMRRTMSAKIDSIKNLNDAFFVILKSVFTPDLGNQNSAQMLQVAIANKRCFVNYNVAGADNYFDFNVYDDRGYYFKIYIKDKGARLDLDKALTIISTAY